MNSFQVGSRVSFQAANQGVIFGIVQDISLHADGTQVATILPENSNKTIQLPVVALSDVGLIFVTDLGLSFLIMKKSTFLPLIIRY
ncbi:hypothetical protein PNOK_0066300 [Pyrrhoderma noxium]|uniref:Uncharacterized protein n=1 Tax=Pyrrhoderma noxium TaxID=2282107 RepID=A0A286UVW6_9AGAM|nr:hypothetical protein PNOK_0066300 [Pyrrhoderma noxium]